MLEVIKLVFPIVTVMLVGYIAARFSLLPYEAGPLLCRYLFYFSLPFLTFANIYKVGLDNLLNVNFILAALLTIFIVIAFSVVVFRFGFRLRESELVLMTLGSFYVNATYMGMPVATMILSSVTPPLIILVLQAGFFFPITLFLLDKFSSGQIQFKFKDVLLMIIKNPLLIAAGLAVVSLFLRVRYPEFIMNTLDMLGKPASPAGLFALGFTCHLPADKRIRATEARQALTVTLFKLLVQPTIAWLIGTYVFHLDHWWLTALVVCAMLPTAINMFIVSQKYSASENESKLVILFTTFGFTLTVSVFLLIFGTV